MIVSQAAVVVMASTGTRVRHRLPRWRFWRHDDTEASREAECDLDAGLLRPLPAFAIAGVVSSAPPPDPDAVPRSVVGAGPGEEASPTAAQEPGLTSAERRARAAAVRGLMRGRDGRYDLARAAFGEAARLDPRLDVTTVPFFWDLPRAAQEAAVAAYEEADREPDAAALRATIDYTFRPKLVRRRPQLTATPVPRP